MRNSQVDWLPPHIHCDNNKYFIHTVVPRYNEGQGLAIFVRYDEVLSIYLTITGVKKIVRYTEDVVI